MFRMVCNGIYWKYTGVKLKVTKMWKTIVNGMLCLSMVFNVCNEVDQMLDAAGVVVGVSESLLHNCGEAGFKYERDE